MLIQTPDYARKLQRRLRLTSLPDSVLAPESVGVFLLDDLRDEASGVEFPCFGSGEVTAVAAEFAVVVLTRIGTGYEALLSRIMVNSPTAQIIRVSIPLVAVAGLTPSPNTNFRDLEAPGRPASEVGTDTVVATPSMRNVYPVRVLANQVQFIETQIRLGEGVNTRVLVSAGVANTGLEVGFDWVETPPFG